jgi:hypothetical protein
MDPITFANLPISVGLFSTQSENNSEICSVSILFLARRFFLVLSIEFVRHFLKMNWSSSQMVTEIIRDLNDGRVYCFLNSMNSLRK